jgi:hypothetical protein
MPVGLCWLVMEEWLSAGDKVNSGRALEEFGFSMECYWSIAKQTGESTGTCMLGRLVDMGLKESSGTLASHWVLAALGPIERNFCAVNGRFSSFLFLLLLFWCYFLVPKR